MPARRIAGGIKAADDGPGMDRHGNLGLAAREHPDILPEPEIAGTGDAVVSDEVVGPAGCSARGKIIRAAEYDTPGAPTRRVINRRHLGTGSSTQATEVDVEHCPLSDRARHKAEARGCAAMNAPYAAGCRREEELDGSRVISLNSCLSEEARRPSD